MQVGTLEVRNGDLAEEVAWLKQQLTGHPEAPVPPRPPSSASHPVDLPDLKAQLSKALAQLKFTQEEAKRSVRPSPTAHPGAAKGAQRELEERFAADTTRAGPGTLGGVAERRGGGAEQAPLQPGNRPCPAQQSRRQIRRWWALDDCQVPSFIRPILLADIIATNISSALVEETKEGNTSSPHTLEGIHSFGVLESEESSPFQ